MFNLNRKVAAVTLAVAGFIGLGVGPAAAHAEQSDFGCYTNPGYGGGGRANLGPLHYLTYIGITKADLSQASYYNVYVYKNNGTLVYSDSSSAGVYTRSWPNPSIFVGSGGYVDWSYRNGSGGVCYDRANAFVG